MLPSIHSMKFKEPLSKTIEEINLVFKGKYTIIKEVGHGTYASVFEGIETKNKKIVAIKKFCNALTSPKLAKLCLREIEITKQSKHENMVKLLKVGCSATSVYLIMDYMPTDLRKLINSPTYFDHYQIKRIMYEIMLLLNYLHSSEIIHRDIKPANILFRLDDAEKFRFKLKICDFGLSRSVKGLKTCRDFDKVYRIVFGTSLEQNTNKEVAKEKSNSEDEEDLDEHVTTNISKYNTQMAYDMPHKNNTTTPPSEKFAEGIKKLRHTSLTQTVPQNLGAKITVSAVRSEFFKDVKLGAIIERELTSHIASRWYRAPEVILLEKSYTTSIDIWGAGCVFAELLQMINGNRAGYLDRRPLFPGSSCFPLSPQLKPGSDIEIEHFSPGDQLMTICKILGSPIGDMTNFITDKGAKEYLQLLPYHDKTDLFLLFPECNEEEIDLLTKLLSFNPQQRITAKEALRHRYFISVRTKEREIEGEEIIMDNNLEGEAIIKKLIEKAEIE